MPSFLTNRSNERSGFSLLEVLVTVSVVGAIVAIAAVGYSNLRTTVLSSQEQQNIETVNRAVEVYLANGGKLAGVADPDEVIRKLKTVRSSEDTRAFAGAASGATIDDRLEFRELSKNYRGTGVVWNPAELRFQSGKTDGNTVVGHFALGTAPSAPIEEEREASSLSYARESDWVWDYVERDAPDTAGPSTFPTTQVEEHPSKPTSPPIVVTTPPTEPEPPTLPTTPTPPETKTIEITFRQLSSSSWALNQAYLYVNSQTHTLGDSDGGTGNTVRVQVEVNTTKNNEIGLAVFSNGRLLTGNGKWVYRGGSGYAVNTSNGDSIIQIAPGASFAGKSSARAKYAILSAPGGPLSLEVGVEDSFALDPLVFGNDYDYDDFRFSIHSSEPVKATFAGAALP